MNKCKKCGAPIKFIKTKRGKWMPVNPELKKAQDCKMNTVLIKETGNSIVVLPNGFPDESGYESHFSTCPAADEFRRKD